MTLSHWITTALYLICLSLIVSGEDATTISIHPAARRQVGEEVTVICKVATRWNTNTILWWRKLGKLRQEIGKSSLIEASFENGNRYQASAWGEKTGVGFKLSITNLQHEDSASIGCSVRGLANEPTAYVNLAVCDDVENQACLCISKVGFSSPNCYEKDPSIAAWEKRYNMATTGLGVCLAIAIIYGLVMSGLAGIDCLARMAAIRKKKSEQAKQHKEHDPRMYEASEELVLDPNDSMSQGRDYNKITTEAVAHSVAHTNKAYNADDDVDYQKLDDSLDTPHNYSPLSYNRPAENVNANAALPSPHRLETHDTRRYPRSPNDGFYSNVSDARSPGAWSTHSDSTTKAAFNYPDVSPRYAQPSPRNAYSAQHPAKAANYAQDYNLKPKQLYYDQNGQNSAHNPQQDDYDHYLANPSGAYIDKTGLSV